MNPYRKASRISRERRGFSWGAVFILVGVIISMFVIRPIFLESWSGHIGEYLESLLFRFSALITAAMALHTYSAIVRSSEHGIISIHPILGKPFLWSSFENTIRETWLWWVSSSILLLPLVELGEYLAFALSISLLIGSWVGGIGAGYCINLGSIWVARSPRAHIILDMVRGQNPREQAAFIYAPGIALIVVGLTLVLGAGGLRAALVGQHIWGLLVLLPYGIGLLGFFLALRIVEEELLRVGSILVDIDAHWHNIEEGEDPNSVYLDWLGSRRPELLRALRAGWREYRVYPILSWGVGFLGGLMIWTGKLSEGLWFASFGMVGLGSLSWQLQKKDPKWLDLSLNLDENKIRVARFQLIIAYGMGVWLPVSVLGFVTQGGRFVLSGASLLILLVLLAFFSVFFSRKLAHYLPLAFFVWALSLRIL